MTDVNMTHTRWLKKQCNRYVDGFCFAESCLRRGGETEIWAGVKDGSKATCPAHEILLRLEELESDKRKADEFHDKLLESLRMMVDETTKAVK